MWGGFQRDWQVISGKKYWSDGTPVAGQQFEYSFDDIGNRKETRAGGGGAGLNLRSASYSASALNQYTSRDVPGFVDIVGVANPGGAVTVNGNAAQRQGEYFHHALAVANSSQPWHGTVEVRSAYPPGAVESGAVFVPRTPESFGHDADGNLTPDGQWVYTWDAESRLVRMVSANTNPAVGPQQRIEFGYDWHGRRISKRVWNNTSGTGAPAADLKFVYDLSAGPAGGWNLLAILDSAFRLQTSFAWGLDLSGTMDGAGGVGGLLSATVHTGPNAGTYFYAYDGNGNVMALVNAADGSVAARYEYGPFGELLRATGPMAKANPFRFSTKYQDDETGLLYYGYRYYDPGTGRWPNRDPIGQWGGDNLYGFVGNAPEDTRNISEPHERSL
jgi:RHS repeat-associated protein